MMPSVFPRPTELAQAWVREILCLGDHVVDATLGNGHDALFLTHCVGATGKVIGFDIQAVALVASTKLMEDHGIARACYEWHQVSHALMTECIQYPVKAVMFNLGYLPGADHTLITVVDQTIAGLQAATKIVKDDGIITVVCYPGHLGGEEEMMAVREWACSLGDDWHVVHYEKWATRKKAPALVALQRKDKTS
jgi:hypothetical protein